MTEKKNLKNAILCHVKISGMKTSASMSHVLVARSLLRWFTHLFSTAAGLSCCSHDHVACKVENIYSLVLNKRSVPTPDRNHHLALLVFFHLAWSSLNDLLLLHLASEMAIT